MFIGPSGSLEFCFDCFLFKKYDFHEHYDPEQQRGLLLAMKPVLWLSRPVRIGVFFFVFFFALVMGITLLDKL